MNEEKITEIKENTEKLKIRPYEEVKKHLDKLANETAYNSAIEFSKLFKVKDA
jgi:hypothetical protein